jgi:hypothetical protein
VNVLAAVPAPVVTDHLYLPAAIVGTTAVIFVELLTVYDAVTVPSLTLVTPTKFVPLIVTV